MLAWLALIENRLDVVPSPRFVKRLRLVPRDRVVAALAAVTACASRHDVAEVMLATFADRHDVLHFKVTTAPAVGAAVLKPAPVLP